MEAQTEKPLYYITVKTISESMSRSVVEAGKFKIQFDEPPEFGGTDIAPNPLEYLLAAHGACLNYVTHFIAKELDITIESLQIDFTAGLDTEKLSGISATPRAGFQSIEVMFNIKASKGVEKIEELLEAVNLRCPVSDNITNLTPVNIAYNIVQ